MLKPREADIPALFLVLVVLPLVAYIILGKWSEAAKKRERISLLAHLAAEEALRAEAMAAASVIPLASPSKNVLQPVNTELHFLMKKNGPQVCARCSGPATTRCSRCKSVRYCSGKCQIIHWRQAHKQECQPVETTTSSSSLNVSVDDSILFNDDMKLQLYGNNIRQGMMEKAPSGNAFHPSLRTAGFPSMDYYAGDTSQVAMRERRNTDKRCSRKSNRELSKRETRVVFESSHETSLSEAPNLPFNNNSSSKEALVSHKSSTGGSVVSEEELLKKQNVSGSNVHVNDRAGARSTMHESRKHQGRDGNLLESRNNCRHSNSSCAAKSRPNVDGNETEFVQNGGNLFRGENTVNREAVKLNCYLETVAVKGGVKPKSSMDSVGPKTAKLSKSAVKVSGENSFPEPEKKGQITDESSIAILRDSIPVQEGNGAASVGIVKMIGLRQPTKLARQNLSEPCDDRHKKIKMLFPYEEFVKFFQCDVFDLSPRGLVNTGNSCYANAVLQCLTCTKPLIIYLLRRSHSRACCGKDWCLMCELEQHVMMLRERGGPLSPSRILLHMRSINCQIGDGSQEDAHEFLRLLVASMQSICLEGLGGESKVDPILQETTFIQHTFGGRLQSKVKCLGCYHESERYENIMDLTLEIYGWVESLEDALTQFTTPEDLDGENMYRCGRCAAYVRARKQLSIHEAPNILTIVLKRFQEGRYGKINKYITFPDMLDMVPFMTGTGDIPPLYMLYAVIVHLDTLNASFSGHYVSYVKDLQGHWFRIDDTEVHLVPMSQVMSEGAYMLFYMRSYPRPERVCTGKSIRQKVPAPVRQSTLKDQKPSRPEESKPTKNFVGTQPSADFRPEIAPGLANQTPNGIHRSRNSNILPVMGRYAEPASVEFSDATSSDWSLFTSSDEASFTTESTRDSFSTVDCADACNVDPFAIFNTSYGMESSSRNTIACRMFANSRPQTRFVLQEKGYVLDSCLSCQPLNRVQKGDNFKQASDCTSEFPSDSTNCQYVKYGSNPRYGHDQTSGHCIL